MVSLWLSTTRPCQRRTKRNPAYFWGFGGKCWVSAGGYVYKNEQTEFTGQTRSTRSSNIYRNPLLSNPSRCRFSPSSSSPSSQLPMPLLAAVALPSGDKSAASASTRACARTNGAASLSRDGPRSGRVLMMRLTFGDARSVLVQVRVEERAVSGGSSALFPWQANVSLFSVQGHGPRRYSAGGKG